MGTTLPNAVSQLENLKLSQSHRDMHLPEDAPAKRLPLVACKYGAGARALSTAVTRDHL